MLSLHGIGTLHGFFGAGKGTGQTNGLTMICMTEEGEYHIRT